MIFLQILNSVWKEIYITIGYLFQRDSRNKLVVEQYPDLISGRGVSDMFPKFKGHLQNDLDRCTGCGDCMKVCPVLALKMDSKVERDGSIIVNSFSIDLGRCFSCSACVDICAPASLSFSKRYELAAESAQSLVAVYHAKTSSGPIETARIRAYEVRR